MNHLLLIGGIFLSLSMTGEKDEYFGRYNLCSGGGPKILSRNIILTDENQFYYSSVFKDAFYEYLDFSGDFQLVGDTIILKPKRFVMKSGDSNPELRQVQISSTKVYISNNNWKNRRKDRKMYFKNIEKSWIGKLQYHDFDVINQRYFEEEYYWNYMLILKKEDDGWRLESLDADYWPRNRLHYGNFCKQK